MSEDMDENAEVLWAFSATYTYRIEILRGEWTHIHCPNWESTESYGDAMEYATRVRDDHPGVGVRIIESIDGYPDHEIRIA